LQLFGHEGLTQAESLPLIIRPCYCNDCLESIRSAGRNPLDDADVLAFARETMLRFCREVKAIAGDKML
jgi:hypothetical protein